MTFRTLYLAARKRLAQAGVEEPGFDAAALAEKFLGLDRPALAVRGQESPPPQAEARFWEAVCQRAERRPLQYILGQWPFMGLSLEVGEGVLVPREDTAVVVEALAARLQEQGVPDPVGLDLCAGTGAAALGLCNLLPGAQGICVELDPVALGYLKKNLGRCPACRLQALQGDVLDPETAQGLARPGGWDFLLSNPPYIARGELPGLQPEVQREPALALDGGEDGLDFYRAIAWHWVPLLRPGGLLALEIGETQAQAVWRLLESQGLEELRVYKDWAGLDRALVGARGSC